MGDPFPFNELGCFLPVAPADQLQVHRIITGFDHHLLLAGQAGGKGTGAVRTTVPHGMNVDYGDLASRQRVRAEVALIAG